MSGQLRVMIPRSHFAKWEAEINAEIRDVQDRMAIAGSAVHCIQTRQPLFCVYDSYHTLRWIQDSLIGLQRLFRERSDFGALTAKRVEVRGAVASGGKGPRSGPTPASDAYVPVTRKVSLKNETGEGR